MVRQLRGQQEAATSPLSAGEMKGASGVSEFQMQEILEGAGSTMGVS